MKLQPSDVNIERGGKFIESMFGISAEDSAHILMILRNKLYSNKILAVIREYCANAADAMVEVGKGDEPFEVHLPTSLEPTLRIRDYGPGLSEDEVRNLYVMYGASTKRKTNDAIGQLGLGCKSAFAYTEQFTVVSWHEGQRSTYCAYIDETKVGKIALMDQEDSDEPDGIEIQVPVDKYDVHDFKKETFELLQFFKPLPTIFGTKDELKAPRYWLSGTLTNGVKWACSRNTSAHVVMGGIPYPLNADDLSLSTWHDLLGQFIDVGIHLFVDIGDVEVTANREALEFTEHTEKTLRAYLEEASKLALKEVGKTISDAMSYREAQMAFARTQRHQKFWKGIARVTNWQGKKLDGLCLQSSGYSSKDSYTINHPWKSARGWRWSDTRNISASEDLCLFEVDDKNAWKARIRDYCEHHGLSSDNVYAIKFDSQEARDKVFADRQLSEYRPIKTSKCKIPKAARAAALANRGPRSTSHIGKIFSLDSSKGWHENRSRRSEHWTRVKDYPDNKKKYYVTLNIFRPIIFNDVMVPLSSLKQLLNISAAARLKLKPEEIYGVKVKEVSKLDTTWIPLGDAIKEAVESTNLMQQLADAHEYSASVTKAVEIFIPKLDEFPKKSLVTRMLTAAKKLKKTYNGLSKDNLQQHLTHFLSQAELKKPAPSIDFQALMDRVKKRYPLPNSLGAFPEGSSGYYGYYNNREKELKDSLPHIVRYVELVDQDLKLRKKRGN